MVAEGVRNAVVVVLLGAVPNVTVTPPVVYPVPDTSVTAPVNEVVVVPSELAAVYKAALNTSAVATVCAGIFVAVKA